MQKARRKKNWKGENKGSEKKEQKYKLIFVLLSDACTSGPLIMTTEGLFTCRFWAPSWFYSQTQESGGRESRGKKSPFFLFHFPFSFKTLKKIYFFYICFSTSFLSGLDWRSQREREVSTFYTWKLVSNLQFFPFLLLSLHRIYRCCLFKLMAVFGWQPCPFRWFLWSFCHTQTQT